MLSMRAILELDVRAFEERDQNDLHRLIGKYVSRAVYLPDEPGKRKGYKVGFLSGLSVKNTKAGMVPRLTCVALAPPRGFEHLGQWLKPSGGTPNLR